MSETSHISAADKRRDRKAALLAMRAQQRTRQRRMLRWGIAPIKAAYFEILTLKFARKRATFLDEYLSKDSFKGLHIGCGPNRKEAWINTDILIPRLPWTPASDAERAQDFPLDLTHPLPFPDASLDVIYGEQVIEHIEKDDARAFFLEARRVLRPGGVLRLSTPDLDGTCRVFLGLDPDANADAFEPYWYEDEWSPEFWINATFRYWGHLYIWNLGAMQEELKAAGFSNVWRVEKGETQSGIPELEHIESRVAVEGTALAHFYAATSLTIEARV